MFLYRKPTPLAWVGIGIVTMFIVIAIFAPVFAPFGEAETVGDTWAAMSRHQLLGTDNIGRDMLSRLIYGARMTIGVTLVTTVLSFTIGTLAGLFASIGGPVVDQILSRFVDVMLSIPLLVFALVVLSMFGSSIPTLILTIAVLDSTRVFRICRAVALNIAVLEYVEAARLRGEGTWWIMRREILPNALPPMIAEFGMRFCFNLLFVAGLSFLGLGIQPPYADWGGMVRDNSKAISFGLPAPLWPAAAIALMTIGVNLVVDWFLSINARPSGASAEM
ncbi:ABC transporter permease [Mesorhizobium sp. BH1-1-4]|uniref:ABC transporter permease n=1 Tax=Mesorhizobium sp. BH1-1-4 TaxID=2876662 RepID=UPI001CD0AE72|nr:ABC transporter permease [Mesorhizobium sp. BH1-1-4]MBZ9994009.1 ABC transporter permease [Mesorhizobium sp. BH1-1-4]